MQVTLKGISYEIVNCSDDLVMKLAEALQGSLPAPIADAQSCYAIKTAIPSIDPNLCSYKLLLHPNNVQEQVFSKNLDTDEIAEIVGAITVGMLERRIERLKELPDNPKAIAKIKTLTDAIEVAKKELSGLKLNILLADSIEVNTVSTDAKNNPKKSNGFAPPLKPKREVASIAPVINNMQLAAMEADEPDLQSEIDLLRAELAQYKGN